MRNIFIIILLVFIIGTGCKERVDPIAVKVLSGDSITYEDKTLGLFDKDSTGCNLTLRDFFASQALPICGCIGGDPNVAAIRAYNIADAMLKQRRN